MKLYSHENHASEWHARAIMSFFHREQNAKHCTESTGSARSNFISRIEAGGAFAANEGDAEHTHSNGSPHIAKAVLD